MRLLFLCIFLFISQSPLASSKELYGEDKIFLLRISDELSSCMIKYAGNFIESNERAGDIADAAISSCDHAIDKMRDFSLRAFVDNSASDSLQREQRIIADDFVQEGLKDMRSRLIKSILDFRSNDLNQ